MKLKSIDHFVLTVASIDATCRFYSDALGMDVVEFAEGRKALSFGTQKINLHEHGHEFEPKAATPLPGTADFCLIVDGSLESAVRHLASLNIKIEEGIVKRTGAAGPIRSIYIRDPDQNLIEISEHI